MAIPRDLDEITALRIMPKTIEAVCYNHVRLALRRLGIPLRVTLPDHKGLDVILDNDYWICVDGANEDQLVMVWTEFDTGKHNQALFESVPCQLRIYHMCAGLVMGSALDALDQILIKELAST